MCKRLHEAGHAVIVLDNLSTGHRAAVQWGELIEAGLQDTAIVTRTLKERSIGAVMHFAASSLVSESVTDPYSYYSNNVCATLSLLLSMREAGVSRFIFSSSAAIFGNPHAAEIGEDHPQTPINPYGKTKLAVESLLQDAVVAYGLRAVALRYFNAAGADGSGLIGESHQPETHLIPKIFRYANGEKMNLSVFGTDYATRDGSCIRDYVHVTDLADAHLHALEFTDVHDGFHSFNLGNSEGYSVFEIIRATEKLIGKNLDIKVSARRPGDPDILVACSKKARAILGWQPKHADITQILSDAWRWHSNQKY